MGPLTPGPYFAVGQSSNRCIYDDRQERLFAGCAILTPGANSALEFVNFRAQTAGLG